jgi:hypothetical protein
MTDCHRFSVIFDATLLSISSTMENADIFISQILEFLLFTDPELREEMPVAFAGLSEMFCSACKHDTSIIPAPKPGHQEQKAFRSNIKIVNP